jgi:L-amino acid N-acyltransferase YncA
MPGAAAGRMVAIREATLHDVVAITAIYAHHVETGTASFELAAPDVDEMARRYLEITAHGLPYLVAQRSPSEGTLAGYAYASLYRLRGGYRYTVEDSVYVHTDCTGEGVGKALLAAVVDRSTYLGYRQMLAIIGGADNVASIRLHASVGFEEVGRLANVGRKFNKWVDSVIMQRALGRGATTAAD